jgi:hypothetical protein
MDATPESIVLHLLHTPLAAFIGKQLKDSGVKYLKEKFTDKGSYEERLISRVREFMQMQNEQHEVDWTRPERYFWQQDWVWQQVLAFRFFSETLPSLQVEDLPTTSSNMVQPSQAELTQFCTELWSFLGEDKELKKLFVAENYQQEIFEGNSRSEKRDSDIITRLAALEQRIVSTADIETVLAIAEREYIRVFNPKAAHTLLNKLTDYIQQQYNGNKSLLARHNYLIGLTYLEINESKQAHFYLVRAHELQPQNSIYRKVAVLSYARFGSRSKALELAQNIIAEDSLNPAAYAAQIYLAGAENLTTSLASIPVSVTEDKEFRLELFVLLNTLTYSDVELIFQNDLLEFSFPTIITFENRRYWIALAQAIIHFVIGTKLEGQDHQELEEAELTQLRAAYQFLVRYREAVYSAEKFIISGAVWFLRGLAGYYLTNNHTEFNDFKITFPQLSPSSKQHYGVWFATLLPRWTTSEEVLATLAQLSLDEDGNVAFLRFQHLQKLGRKSEAQASLMTALCAVDALELTAYTRARMYLEFFCEDEASRKAFIKTCRDRTQFLTGLPAYLLDAASIITDEARQEESAALLSQALALVDEQTVINYRFDLAGLYQQVKEFAKSNSLLLPLLAMATGAKREQVEVMYLHNLYHQNKNSVDLLQRLREWRNQHAPLRAFYFWEMELAGLLDDAPLLLEVAESARLAFPDDVRFYWKYLHGLHLTAAKGQLESEIARLIAEPERLPRANLFNIALLARLEGWRMKALALLYPMAVVRDDIEARENFFNAYLQSGGEHEETPSEASLGITVEFILNDVEQPPLLLLEDVVNGYHPFANKLLGLKTGDQFTVPNRSGVLLTGQIISLRTPYQALFKDISRQIGLQQGTFHAQAFTIDSGDIKQFEQTLITNFGGDEEARRLRIDELLEDVRMGRQGFSAVARGICSGNGLDAYRLITSDEGRGLPLVPQFLYEHIELKPELAYILDWSTLPLFYQLHEKGLITLPNSLWVARQIPDFLNALIAEKRRSFAPKMSVVISRNSIRPVFYGDDYKEREIDFLIKLLDWVNQYCQTRLVPEKLDLLRQADQEGREWLDDDENAYFAGIIDTLFLADQPDTLLISDDITFIELLQRKGAVVSSEKYLRSFHKDIFAEHILPLMLQQRYVGFTVDSETMYRVFMAEGGRFQGLSLRYLDSLSFNAALEFLSTIHIHDFLKQIYLSGSLLPDQMDRAAFTLYMSFLRFTKLTPGLAKQILGEIRHRFNLLPLEGDRVMLAFKMAWQHSRNS